jgi:cyclophilin family peptidyl-prolyl cis-trans isomerase
MRALVLALVLALSALAAGCGGDDEGNGETTTTTAAAGTNLPPSGECESVEAPPAREPETREAPTKPLGEGSYALVVETSCGSFTIALDTDRAPNTAASLVALASDGYFDDTTFHRVVPGFVIQGGDPTGTGAGGPGYTTVDVPAQGSRYVRGVVAMAKSGAEPPGAAGSQFFVVTGDDVGLPPDYAIVGEVTEGLETVDRIDALGVGDGPPSQPVVIETVTVTES